MTNASVSDSPARSDRQQGLEDETALRKRGMRHRQVSGAKAAAAPESDIQVQDSRSPATAAAAAEFTLEGLQSAEHFRRLKVTFNERNRIGKITARAAVGRVQENGRCVEQSELLVEPSNRCLYNTSRTTISAVRPI